MASARNWCVGGEEGVMQWVFDNDNNNDANEEEKSKNSTKVEVSGIESSYEAVHLRCRFASHIIQI